MAKTYEAIASHTLSGSVASYTFSNIPSTYTDLIIVGLLDFSSAGTSLYLRFNSDTGNNYSATWIQGNGSSAGSSRLSSQSLGLVAYPGWGVTTDPNNVFHTTVMSYANSNVFKTALTSGAVAPNGVSRAVTLWRSTAAITAVTILPGGGNLDAGTLSLYGIKAA
jgi:hypothetical protein